MTMHEQEHIKQTSYAEAMRYMDNAKNALQAAKLESKRYKDAKYVRTACGTAYNGVLLALDAFLEIKGVPLPKGDARKNFRYYRNGIGEENGKLQDCYDDVYKILHLSGYYDGILNAKIIKEGFDKAGIIITRIKPREATP